MVIWITGLSGAGKTEIGKKVYEELKLKYINTVFLDGDLFREVLGRSGHSLRERMEVARRISSFCRFMDQQDIHVVCCTISLFDEIHRLNRENLADYYEVFIDVDMEELIRRDKKGLYSGAIKGEILNVVGIDLPFDEPKNPHLIIDNTKLDKLEEKANKILDIIQCRKGEANGHK
ncbi:adenylylsulfate kinase [Natronincola peptidivorans]|uniref:Adenylylsulfate kinase n=1 Tax=Natronincola peptidivorans TaxID=426128 RepID=A0A1H9ZVY9_9FIRM|nr:adenylyl-sulfate kinase [Natronincola peptidivorans]SES85027.1 adenylylsulfate kinase [Natronincola peptidivorans]